MEINGGLGGRLFPNLGGGILGLEMPLQTHQPPPPQHQTQPSPQNPPHHQAPQQAPPPSQIVSSYTHHELDHHQSQPQLSLKQAAYHYPVPTTTNATKPKHTHQQTGSDEDEPYNNNFGGNDDCSGSGGATEKRKISPWHRMKWTDNMVRLLIMAVYYIGDENVGSDDHKKKTGGGGSNGSGGVSGGLLQKKGKWKSVSRAMMEKGFYVSPQQCEDKFNDLNKRYKRVNDILGKGTACKVVENQSLLETMDLTPKMKDEVKKLLNSKHLFFREMCAYHNSCGHGSGDGAASGGGNGGAHHSPDGAATEQSQFHNLPLQQQQGQQQGQQQHQPRQQDCFHSAQTALLPKSTNRVTADESKMVSNASSDEEDDDDDDEDNDEYDDDDDHHGHGHGHGHSDDDHIEGLMRKRPRREIVMPTSHLAQLLTSELVTVTQDKTKTSREKKQWMLNRSMQLEEEGVKYQYEAFEIEKQRLKWMMYSSKKEREMEKMKLENERKRLENERMLLILRKKELELVEQNPSSMAV